MPFPRSRALASTLLGLACACSYAQDRTPPEPAPVRPAAPGGSATPAAQQLPAVRVDTTADAPESRESLRTDSTSIGKGNQPLRDVPQSLTVITERLLNDRKLDSLKEALGNSAGVSFQAAEGGEEDIRIRGFSLMASGDIFIDGMRDPAFYERDSFNWDRLEVLRGSASLLFGRGSTGGAVNQVSKQPWAWSSNQAELTLGDGAYRRGTADLNIRTGDNAAFRINAMVTDAENWGNRLDKRGVAPSLRWGIGERDEYQVGLYHLENRNGIQYGLPWLTPGPKQGGNYLWGRDPRNYYGAASDTNDTSTSQLNASHKRRLNDDAELRTALRVATYKRDQRASAIRFATAANQPGGLAVNSDTFSDATVLTRGNNLKVMDLDTVFLQSDYSGKQRWFGLPNSVQAGIDLANEQFTGRVGSNIGNKPTTLVGTPNDGGFIDESLRTTSVGRTFEAKSMGTYFQDLLTVAPHWKLLAGLRWDRFEGEYRNLVPLTSTQANNPCSVQQNAEVGRSDSLISKRFGVLHQPDDRLSYHLSYGTSFNTSGDAYQYDSGTARTAPESSRNIELGARIDSHEGDLSTRFALFHSTKYNERNRDVDSVNACNYVLSGERHAAGLEMDIAGRINSQWEVFVSYAWIPEAKVDSSSGAAGTEVVGSRPGLTPRHSAALWSTYKLTGSWRIGAGLNARSRDKPQGLAATSAIEAPSFWHADVMAEYAFSKKVLIKANLINVTNAHYADSLYRGHYVPGKPRQLLVTTRYTF